MDAQAIMSLWSAKAISSPKASLLHGSVTISIEPSPNTWRFEFNENVTVHENSLPSAKGECTITLTQEGLAAIHDGTKTAQQLFLNGALTVKGDVTKAMPFLSIVL